MSLNFREAMRRISQAGMSFWRPWNCFNGERKKYYFFRRRLRAVITRSYVVNLDEKKYALKTLAGYFPLMPSLIAVGKAVLLRVLFLVSVLGIMSMIGPLLILLHAFWR